MHGIVGGPAARCRFPADKAGVAKAAYIHIVFIEIILAPALAGLLADPVNGAGLHNGELRCILFWGVRAENSNRAGPVYLFYDLFFGKVEHIEQALHIQVPAEFWHFLGCSRKK